MTEKKFKLNVDADTSKAMKKIKKLQSESSKVKKNGRKYNIIVGAGLMGFIPVMVVLFFISPITEGVLSLIGKFLTFLVSLSGTYVIGNAVVKFSKKNGNS